MNHSLEQLRQRWENYYNEPMQDMVFDQGAYNDTRRSANAALRLLQSYTGSFSSPLGLWGGNIGRFFSGKWNRHHADIVKDVINNYFRASTSDNVLEWHQRVDRIFTSLKRAMDNNNQTINPDGELSRIIQVIEEKTGVEYNPSNDTPANNM